MRKISRPVVELLRGPMHADSLSDDLKVSTALFNEVVPSRHATQQWDAKYADNQHFQTMGVNEKLIAQMTDELCEDSQHVEACLCWDARNVAPNVVTTARNQNVEWHGYHDLSSTGISDIASDQHHTCLQSTGNLPTLCCALWRHLQVCAFDEYAKHMCVLRC